MVKKTNLSITLDSDIKNDIDSILNYRKNTNGETLNRSIYIENLIKDAVEKEKNIQEHIKKNQEVMDLERQLKEKKETIARETQEFINNGTLIDPIRKVKQEIK